MDTKSIENFNDFLLHSDVFDLWAEHTLFRGQQHKGNLLPSVARGNPRSDTTSMERKMLIEFRRLGASFLPERESDLDLLVRAQHFGLRTRLLDWTLNPLAALWFACAGAQADADGYVYVLTADSLLLDSTAYSSDPFDAKRTGVFQPRLSNPRILAQHGLFTLHRFSEKDGQFVPLERNADTAGNLTEFHIPSTCKVEMVRQLDRLGVNARTLFPDIDGLSLHLNWKYGLV